MIQLKKQQTEQPISHQRKPLDRIQADPKTGLSAAQVTQRIENGWANTPVDPPSKTVREIVRSNL